ncbi:hypothetical protein HAPAU_29120 [Halalkalicoccus paucihalophilus]|uniref:DUF7260 domain-containing protein n=1 Tax=Halalkalicoccus paucihalophilus TaxID=1008153 RepID=A0A151ABM4_9EURY|nr:hypothetical protein [Halalkalicoccus paucihalophilus]KYH24960.1 hypothetical protein HAPAU_29120 [Halalkalicoccus paucihalophilus]
MRTAPVSYSIAILSTISIGILAIGSPISITDPALGGWIPLLDFSAVLAFVGSPTTLSPLQPGELLQTRNVATSSLASSLITWIPRAKAIVQTEQERTRAERDAFKHLGNRVSALEPPSPSSATLSSDHKLIRSLDPHPSPPSTTEGIDAIQQAYRDTVLSIPHYGEEYNEPLVQNMAIEFGEDLTTAITTHSQLTPSLQQAVGQAATAASVRRVRFSNRLDDEATTLTDAEQTLTTTGKQYEQATEQPRHHQSVEDLHETHQQLTTCLETCEQLIEERQTQRTDGHTAEPHTNETVDLQEYLYYSIGVTYPVLVDATTVLERCTTERRRVEDELVLRL